MRISICIPQFNRIAFLKIVLAEIEQQSYDNIEVCISDDASSDDTEKEIKRIKENYKFPVKYHRFELNQGYDRNLRMSMEMSSGDYCFILGNDDSLSDFDAIRRLVNFLDDNRRPDVGFCNNADYIKTDEIQKRAHASKILGSGKEVALKYYSSFSFVAGLIFKRQTFLKYNTAEFDGSIYVQIYLACTIICNGGTFFTIDEPFVYKDVRVDNSIANSYRDTLPRKWSDYKTIDSGLPSYSNVAYEAIRRNLDREEQVKVAYFILKRIYMFTYPFWLIDFKQNQAFVASIGLVRGLPPNKFIFYKQLTWLQKFKINTLYVISSFLGIITPVSLYKKLKHRLYQIAKK